MTTIEINPYANEPPMTDTQAKADDLVTELSEEKHISFDTYLKALALFMMAAEHYTQSRQFEKSLEKLLGVDECGHIPDALYDTDPNRARFDEALRRENILVQPPESA